MAYTGTDSFTYRFNSGGNMSNTATVSILVNASILYVVGNPGSLSTAETQIQDRLVNTLGYSVTLIDDGVVSQTDADGHQAVLVSDTVTLSLTLPWVSDVVPVMLNRMCTSMTLESLAGLGLIVANKTIPSTRVATQLLMVSPPADFTTRQVIGTNGSIHQWALTLLPIPTLTAANRWSAQWISE